MNSKQNNKIENKQLKYNYTYQETPIKCTIRKHNVIVQEYIDMYNIVYYLCTYPCIVLHYACKVVC